VGGPEGPASRGTKKSPPVDSRRNMLVISANVLRSIRSIFFMQKSPNFLRMFDFLIFVLVKAFENVINSIPEKWAYAFARFAGRLAYVATPSRRAAAIENLTIAFGSEKSRAWILRTARKSFEHLGLLVVEFLLIRRWTHSDIMSRITLEGRDNFNLAFMPGNHGICLLKSHFGCFEVSAATVKGLGHKLNLIMTPLKNPFLNKYLFDRGASNPGLTTYPHRGVVKTMIQLLLDGECLAMLADQRGDAERGIFVNFFGTPAPANEVFARFALEGNAWVLPFCTFRVRDGHYKSIFGPHVRIEATGDTKQNLTAVSQQFHEVFEGWLRMHPEQGWWVQHKWRRPPSRHRKKKVAPK
jgi:Kdo2-lipid IVA lauroyltransferase/acyltransferase